MKSLKEAEAIKIAISLCQLPNVIVTERELDSWSVEYIFDWLEVWGYYWYGVFWENKHVDEFIDALQDDDLTPKEAALEYAILMYSTQPDWDEIDQAIVDKWSKSVLATIKTQAQLIYCEWRLNGYPKKLIERVSSANIRRVEERHKTWIEKGKW